MDPQRAVGNVAQAFRRRLAAGEALTVVNPDYPSAGLVERLGRLGLDAVMIDTEQGSPGVESVEHMARAARLAGLCALVRVGSPDPWVVERMLFRGVHGLVAPRLDTAAQARALVETVRYCFPDSWEERVTVVQVESRQAVEELDGFLAIDGIDAYFVGPVDLAKSLGHGGRYRHPDVLRAIDDVVRRVVAAGKAVGMLVTPEDVADWRRKGVGFLYFHVNDLLALGGRHFAAALAAGDAPRPG